VSTTPKFNWRTRDRHSLYLKCGFKEKKRAAAAQAPPLELPKSIIPATARRTGRPMFYGYGRVSTADQHCDTQQMLVESHYKALFAKDYDWGGFYADPDISGSVDIGARPAGTLLMELVEPRDAICVTTFDRLTRAVLGWATLQQRIDREELRLICMDMNADTKTAAGRFVLNVMACKAEFEREQISERVRNRFEALRRRNLYPTNKLVPWGYEVVSTPDLVTRTGAPYGVLTPFAPEQCVMRLITEWNERWGVSQPTIVQYLDRCDFRGRTGAQLGQEQVRRMIAAWKKIAGTADDRTIEHDFWRDGDNAPRPEVELANVGLKYKPTLGTGNHPSAFAARKAKRAN
jgi:DNA invertase Pin-like site-specific DNA recombinase